MFFQAEDGIRDVERSRGLGDVYKRQVLRALNGLTMECVLRFVGMANCMNFNVMMELRLTGTGVVLPVVSRVYLNVCRVISRLGVCVVMTGI